MNLAEWKEDGEVMSERREAEKSVYKGTEVVRVYKQSPL